MDLNTWLASEKGRAAALAKHFGRSPGAISQWRVNGVPVDLMKGVREFTGGEVTLEEMVPDMAPPASPADQQPDFVDTVPLGEHAQATDLIVRGDGTITRDERVDYHVAERVPAALGHRISDRVRLQREHGDA